MRKRIFEIIETSKEGEKASSFYDVMMMITIIVSLIPLAFKDTNTSFTVIDVITVSIFILDYALRFITADYKLEDPSAKSFVIYPFTPMAIIDLVSILPSLGAGIPMLRMLKIIRLLRAARVLRVLKAARYSRSLMIIVDVLKESKNALIAVGTLAVVYILISALVIFNVEPDTFNNFFDAVYWATVSLTTVGYGDIYPITVVGKIISMISSLFGIAIVALPAGIITAGYMERIQSEKGKKDKT